MSTPPSVQPSTEAAAPPRIGVLGAVSAWSPDGAELRLPGQKHRELLARLVAARGGVVSAAALVGDLWDEPAAGALATVRTFVAALRRALEPGRAPRTASAVLQTRGTGYLVPFTETLIDAGEFEAVIKSTVDLPWARRVERLERALSLWRGTPFAEFDGRGWAQDAAVRLTALRCTAVESLAEARLRAGSPEQAAAELRGHLHAHPDREGGWVLLVRALHRAGLRGEALAAARAARKHLVERQGLDPSPALRAVEREVLESEQDLTATEPGEELLRETAAAYRSVGSGHRRRLLASATLLRDLALTNATGLSTARAQRFDTIERLAGDQDPRLVAETIAQLDLPGCWARSDDPVRSARLVAAARDCLDRLGADLGPTLRCRLLAIIGVEARGTRGTDGIEAAAQAETLARELNDPGCLVLALNATFLQSFHRLGTARRRGAIGGELIEVSRRHGFATYEILGHLVRMQAAAALGDVAAADEHAALAEELGAYQESDLVGFFTTWYRALRGLLLDRPIDDIEAGYRGAARLVPGCGMPGVADGLTALTRLTLDLRAGRPVRPGDFGTSLPYVRPLLAAADGDRSDALAELRRTPAPPPDHLAELRWGLLGIAAADLGDAATAGQVRRALTPAAAELLGAGTGMLSLGPTGELLERLGSVAQD